MVGFFTQNTNKKEGIKIKDSFIVIINNGDDDNILKEELLCEVYETSRNKNFRVREKKPSYISFDSYDKYYRTFRVEYYNNIYNIWPGFYFYTIKSNGYEGVILRKIVMNMLLDTKLKVLIPEKI